MYSSRAGADNPLKTFVNLLTICILPASFSPFNYILLIFHIQMHGQPMMALLLNRSRSSQGLLGQVTLTIYINFHSPFLRMLHMKFGFDWPSDSEKKIFEYYGNMHVYCPGEGAELPLGSFFQNYKSSVHLPISIKCFPSNDILTIFPLAQVS